MEDRRKFLYPCDGEGVTETAKATGGRKSRAKRGTRCTGKSVHLKGKA